MNGLNDIVAQDAKEAGRWFSRDNLLINAYWGNKASIVNQRGQTQYGFADGGEGYCIDRWWTNCSLSDPIKITKEGLYLPGFKGLYQFFENDPANGEEVTCSVLLANNTLYSATAKQIDGGGDDFCIAVQSNRKVSGIALVIHHANKASLVLHTHNGLLELPVYNNSVSDDDHVIKDDFIVSIVETRQAVRKPSDGIRLAGTCAMLYQIVLSCAVFPDVCQQLPNRIQLVVARENQALASLHLPCSLIDLLVDCHKDKAADEVEDGILGQNILPHI